MDAVSIVVRMVSPEVTGTVPGHRLTLTGRYPVHIVPVIYPDVVVITVVVTRVTVRLFALPVRILNRSTGKASAGHIGRTGR